MSRPPPQPEYVFCGISGGATCCHYATVNDVNCCIIGSQKGLCWQYSIKTKKCVTMLIDESNNSSIMSCGQLNDGRLWAHVRNVGVRILTVLKGTEAISAQLTSTIATDHYGFCAADLNQLDQLAIPEEGKDCSPSVRVVDGAGAPISFFPIGGGPDAKRGAIMRIKWATADRLLAAFENGSLVLFETATGRELARRDSLHKE
uniref:Uncharacterized protein n=1 Tax=Plectus sambesii TaxID=2011161 RepID=A0A914VE89_9BILA